MNIREFPENEKWNDSDSLMYDKDVNDVIKDFARMQRDCK